MANGTSPAATADPGPLDEPPLQAPPRTPAAGPDSAAAIGAMSLDPPAPARPTRVTEHAQRIAALAGITLWRIELGPGQSFGLPAGLSYALCCVVSGALDVSTPRQQMMLGPEEAALIPASAADTRFSPVTEPVVFLLAAPEL